MANKDDFEDPLSVAPIGPSPQLLEKRRMRDSLMETAKYELQDVGNWTIEGIRSGLYVRGDGRRVQTAHDGKRYQVVVTVRVIPVEKIEK